MRLIDHPQAQAELLEAARYYEQAEPGLGDRFLDAVSRALEIIRRDPERSRLRTGGVRGYKLSDFPYTVFYYDGGTVEVFAYAHNSRRAGYWLDRLSD